MVALGVDGIVVEGIAGQWVVRWEDLRSTPGRR
jgi:hypothetical protein